MHTDESFPAAGAAGLDIRCETRSSTDQRIHSGKLFNV